MVANDAIMKKLEVWAVTKYLYWKVMMQQEIFYYMNETLAESALAYATVAKWNAEFTWRWLSCDDRYHYGQPATTLDKENVEKVNKQ